VRHDHPGHGKDRWLTTTKSAAIRCSFGVSRGGGIASPLPHSPRMDALLSMVEESDFGGGSAAGRSPSDPARPLPVRPVGESAANAQSAAR
jgi:hypothetical protein